MFYELNHFKKLLKFTEYLDIRSETWRISEARNYVFRPGLDSSDILHLEQMLVETPEL